MTMHPTNSPILAFGFLLSRLLRPCWAASPNVSAQAVVISPSEYYDGNDGPWSSFFVRVGTPAQQVRVLVSTASPETLVVLSQYGCTAAAFSGETVPSNCAVSRGVLFSPNASSTWHEVGTYGINGDGVGLEANLGYTEDAEFALETLGVGLTGTSLPNQTVGGIAAAEPFYLGIFGLNTQPVNYTSLGNYSAQSFLTTLKSQGVIPSLSWSYTAGAQYRLKQVYGQLIFSGYDTSRFDTSNSATFTMAGDLTRDLVVSLQSITYSGATQATLLSDPINIFIDSTDSNLWLPDSVCTAFEQSFGITLDDTTGLYLVNSTQHSQLLSSGAQVTFTLSDVSTGGQTVTITLPYNAFDLTAQPPLVPNTTYYFPLKRAANSTQYTLGRTFLQEAYLSADYERSVFNVSACVWNEGAVSNVITVQSTDAPAPSSPSPSSSSKLSSGAIAGTVIGCVAVVALLAAIVLLVRRNRRPLIVTYKAHDHEPDQVVMTGPVFNSAAMNYRPSDGSRPSQPSEPSQPTPSRTVGGTSDEISSGIGSGIGSGISSGRYEGLTNDFGKPIVNHYGNPPQIHELHGESSSAAPSDSGEIHEMPDSALPNSAIERDPWGDRTL